MMEIDPITLEIIQNALSTAGNEMAVAMYRTAYSTVVRDCMDYSTSLCNAEGEMIAQGLTLPMHLGTVPYAMQVLLEKYGNDLHQGDVFILNDPFDGGIHTPDIYIIKPIFWRDECVAFAVCTAHHLDVGGRVPGTAACDNRNIYQEGLRIPLLKLYEKGKANETIFSIVRQNVRVPRMLFGDLRAQLAACHIGERSIHNVIERYGLDVFKKFGKQLIDYTERLMRAEIATWPDGSFTFTDYLDSDGVGGGPVPIVVKIKIEGSTLTADFTGSSPQVGGAINCTRSFVISCVTLCVRAVMKEAIPANAGMFKPLNIITPPGTIVNVLMPGASSMRGVTGFRVVDAVFGALAGLLPDRVFAAGEGGNSLVILGGQYEDRSNYVYCELFSGTWGARPDRDGNDGLCNVANVASNIPIEQAESEYPVLIEYYGFVPDSGGGGKFRGGLAIERQWQLLGDKAELIIRSDRRDHRPYGLAEGKCGLESHSVLKTANGQVEKVLPQMVSTTMSRGDRIYHRIAGGGGYGNALKRNPAAVAWDVKNGKVSCEGAIKDYGVVLDPVNYEVDHGATIKLRRKMENKPSRSSKKKIVLKIKLSKQNYSKVKSGVEK